MLLFNDVLDDCVVIVKDDNGNNRVISGSVDSILFDWWHECNYVASNDSLIVYAACFGVEVKCKTFGEYMEMIDRIAGGCDGMERGE